MKYEKISNTESVVTVIIPVYNSEKTLETCVESIMNQSWKNLEIIIVDDGSTDKSADICTKLSQREVRIKALHQVNKGVSSARNLGLEHAHGEYIVFVDSDDELPKHSIRTRVESIGNADLLIAGYEVVNLQNEIEYRIDKFNCEKCTQIEMLARMFGEQSCGYQGYLWNKLFRKELIKRHNLKFVENIHYNEDRLFIIQYLINSRQVRFVDTPIYLYKINLTGAMGLTKTCTEKVYKKWITEFSAYRMMCEELNAVDAQIYYLCSLDAMRSAIDHRKEVKAAKKEKKYFSRCIKEFSKKCFTCKKIPINIKIKIIGHYILAR